MGKVVIVQEENRLFSFLFQNNRPEQIDSCALPESGSPTGGLTGSIYLARVKDVVPSLKGMFLIIDREQTVFLPFSEWDRPLMPERELSGRKLPEGALPVQGDEVVVQIIREAIKTKPPAASTRLTLTGQYCVCGFRGHGLRCSGKLTLEQKEYLLTALRANSPEGRKRYPFILRTNAGFLTDMTPLLEEMQTFIRLFDQLQTSCLHRTCFSCLYRPEPEIVRLVRELPLTAYDEIVTDQPQITPLLEEAFPEKPVRLYQEEHPSLSRLYGISGHLKEALARRVWLPCGGYLVLEPTEAMVVIDVNSGKLTVKKDRHSEKSKQTDSPALLVNLEAAREIARQLRLRNYSGMIMVDFINLPSLEEQQRLLVQFDRWLKEDRIRTRLIDMTALGIVEVTRRKVSRPLHDFFKNQCEKT